MATVFFYSKVPLAVGAFEIMKFNYSKIKLSAYEFQLSKTQAT